MNMRLLIVTSFVLVFTLSVFPVDADLRWLRPEFVALMVIYWSMYAPQHFGLFSAWSVGLLQDIIDLGPLGHNALALSIIACICQLSYQRIRHYTVWQQSGWIFVIVIIYLVFGHWTNAVLGREVAIYYLLLNTLISAFLWPLIVFFVEFSVPQSANWHGHRN